MNLQDDPVIHEVNVCLSQSLKNCLYLLQYPLRPGYFPFESSSVVSAKVKPQQQKLEIDVAIRTHGEHYSRSRGEQMAQAVDSTSSNPLYKSGLIDSQTLVSDGAPHNTSKYVAAVLKDGELHLNTLESIVQLRPCLRHLEQADSAQHSHPGVISDGDTTATESEGEEARPVHVKFARSGSSARGHQQKSTEPDDPWIPLTYHPLESDEATEERRLLFAGEEDHTDLFTIAPENYLNMVCLAEASAESENPVGPMGVLSLTQLKTLPLQQQVTKLLKNAVLIQFDRLCTLLGRSRQERAGVLDLLQKDACLVQGLWVATSSLILPSDATRLINARDYILWCFTQNHTITRKDLASVVKITNAELKSLLNPIAVTRPGGGWQLKLPADTDFITRYPPVTRGQQDFWKKRHQELISLLGVGTSPDAGLTKQSSITQGGDQERPSTPGRAHKLGPGAIHVHAVKQEGEASESLIKFCKDTLGKKVLALQELNDSLRLYQANAPQDDSLKTQDVSIELLESAVLSIGAVEIQQCDNRRLFAVIGIGDPHIDKYRHVVITMFKSSSGLRRKQIMEEYHKTHGEQADNKTLTNVLKDLCYSKGSLWYLTGTC